MPIIELYVRNMIVCIVINVLYKRTLWFIDNDMLSMLLKFCYHGYIMRLSSGYDNRGPTCTLFALLTNLTTDMCLKEIGELICIDSHGAFG